MQLRLKFFQIGFFFSITPQRKTVSVLLPVKQAPKKKVVTSRVTVKFFGRVTSVFNA